MQVDVDLEEDLTLDTTFAYLLGLGRVKILLAGPPCRTMRDNTLLVRTMALGIAARQSNEELQTGDLGALVEQPRDPSEYCRHVPASDLPSLFAMPEWEVFAQKLELKRYTINQAYTARVKPEHCLAGDSYKVGTPC